MLNISPKAYAAVELIASADAANTAAATSAWVAIAKYDGPLIVTQNVGAVTGSIVGKLQHADDGSGTNAADITGAAYTSATGHGSQFLVVDSAGLKPYLRYIGTVTTGPAQVAVTMLACDQYA